MALKNVFGAIALESTQDFIAYIANAILEKMGRLDAADRLVVNLSETTLPTVTTVTTCTTLTNAQGIGGYQATYIPFQISNIGAQFLYDNIKVT